VGDHQPALHVSGGNYARSEVVEGKGFVYLDALSIEYFVDVTLQNAANCCATCARALSRIAELQSSRPVT
jgi:hypothetical protein